MARWFSKRWVWAALAGAAVTVGMAAARGDGPPKVGAVISLNIDGKGERQFKVLKSDKQPDGTYLSELKDTKTGETITLVDKSADPAPGGTNVPKSPEPPKTKRAADPMAPPAAASDPMKDPAKEREKRTILGRIFGDRDKTPAMPGPSAMPAPEPEKKPGLLGRVFGPKKPTGPSMPAPSGDPARSSSSSPPAVIPTPPGGVAGGTKLPPFPATRAPSTVEPPRVMPSKPAAPFVPPPAPSVPAFPAPSVPTPMPSVPAPIPKPLPAFPAPVPAPTVPPAPASGGGLPPIPVPPGGTSAAKPIQVVVPVGFVPVGIAYDRDVQPFVIALQTMSAPSARLTAAKGLADGRHASSDGVKAVLFQAARMDPCGEVRAACIDHLCKLGYFSPQFLGYIQAVCEDKDPMVSASAQAACAR